MEGKMEGLDQVKTIIDDEYDFSSDFVESLYKIFFEE